MKRISFIILLMMAFFVSRQAMANPNSSDDISQDILDVCDEHAMPYEGYAPIILSATEGLADLGVFNKNEFRGVSIGFCDLRSVEGPVATTSCARDTILLDTKYAGKGERFALKVNLAHEMKHHFQLREQKNRFGESYCISDRFNADKAWMEKEADEFGDNVAALLFIGRTIEIKNECPAAVSVYLEADNPVGAARDLRGFVEVAPQSTVAAPGRSLSKFFRFYAQSEPYRGRRWFWRNATTAHKRMIDGKPFGLKRSTLSNRDRSTGPFQLKLSCSNDQNR